MNQEYPIYKPGPWLPERPTFIIFALPRSRTAWLARFLTYGSWVCCHEKAAHLRSIEEMQSALKRPRTGFAETAAGPAWHLIKYYCSNLHAVVIRRAIDDTMNAMTNAASEVGVDYDLDKLYKITKYGERCLERISKVPGTKTFRYDDLDCEDACQEIFEFCLPYKFDRTWYLLMRQRNIQVDLRTFFHWYICNREEIENFKHLCKMELIRLHRNERLPCLPG